MASKEGGVARLTGLVLALGVYVCSMPAPLLCPAHPHLHPSLSQGTPTLTPPYPKLQVTVRVAVNNGMVRLVPVYVEAPMCMDTTRSSSSSSTTLCFSHTDISLPTQGNLLGKSSRLVELRHHFRRTAGGVAKDDLVVAVVVDCLPPLADPPRPMLDKGAVREVEMLLNGEVNHVAIDLRDLLPSPNLHVPYYQFRSAAGQWCQQAEWVVYEGKMGVSCSLLHALGTYQSLHVNSTNTTTTTTTTAPTTVTILYSGERSRVQRDKLVSTVSHHNSYHGRYHKLVDARPPTNQMLAPNTNTTTTTATDTPSIHSTPTIAPATGFLYISDFTLTAATITPTTTSTTATTASATFPRHPRQAVNIDDSDFTISISPKDDSDEDGFSELGEAVTKIPATIAALASDHSNPLPTSSDTTTTTTTTTTSSSNPIPTTNTPSTPNNNLSTEFSTKPDTTTVTLPPLLPNTTPTATTVAFRDPTAEAQVATTTTDTNTTDTTDTTATTATTNTTTPPSDCGGQGRVSVAVMVGMMMLVVLA